LASLVAFHYSLIVSRGTINPKDKKSQ